MSEQWDRFPINIKEMTGPIKRESFSFQYSRLEVWQGGQCVSAGSSIGTVSAQVQGVSLLVEVNDPAVRSYIIPRFSFGEISTNGERVLWSKDILNAGGPVERINPDLSSLFYKNGSLAKVTFTIHNSITLVEFYQ